MLRPGFNSNRKEAAFGTIIPTLEKETTSAPPEAAQSRCSGGPVKISHAYFYMNAFSDIFST